MKFFLKKYFHLIIMAAIVVVFAYIPLNKRGFNVVDMEPEPLLEEGEYIISPYDDIFRRIARRHHVDWRLLCALAYCESRFDAEARSPRGAIGMMQVMPHIARHWDVMEDELLDPAINIDVACRLYKSMQKMLRFPKGTSERDKMAFTIASYNCGASRIIDARNLADSFDEPKYEWDSVKEYILLLSSEEFYNHEAVCGGQFKEGALTVAYANKVLDLYDRYVAMADE